MGPHIVRKLNGLGHEVTVFHRGQTIGDLPDSVKHMFGNRNRLDDFTADFKMLKPDVVVDMMLLNRTQAEMLVDVFKGISRRLVVASSCDVYLQYDLLRGVEEREVANHKINENAPLRNKLYPYRTMVPDEKHQLYDYDKILIEQVVISHPDLPATVLRLPMVYGPNDYQHRFWSYIKRMLDNRPTIILDKKQADWRITRGFVENCAGAIITAALDKKAEYRIYNVGEPEALTEREWVRKIADIIGWKGDVVTFIKDKLPEHLKSDLNFEHHLNIDTGCIRGELRYEESVTIEDALNLTIEWEKANPPETFEDSFDYDAEDNVL